MERKPDFPNQLKQRTPQWSRPDLTRKTAWILGASLFLAFQDWVFAIVEWATIWLFPLKFVLRGLATKLWLFSLYFIKTDIALGPLEPFNVVPTLIAAFTGLLAFGHPQFAGGPSQ